VGWWWWWRTNLSDASTRTHPHTKLHTHLFCCVWQVKAHLSMVMVHHPSMTQHKYTPTPTSFAHISYHKVWQGGGGFEHGDGAPSLYDAAHTPPHTKLHTHLFCCVWQVEVHLSMVMVHHPSMTQHTHTPTHTKPHKHTPLLLHFTRFGRVEVLLSTVMVHHPFMTQHMHTPPHTKLHTHLICCVWQVEVHLSMVMVHHPSMTQHKHTPTHTKPHTHLFCFNSQGLARWRCF